MIIIFMLLEETVT